MTTSDAVLLPGRSRIAVRLGRIVGVALLAWVGALTPSQLMAAESDSESRKQAEAPKERSSQQKGASVDPADKAPNDLESCKRDADGMRGPERSRFMTSCIRERK